MEGTSYRVVNKRKESCLSVAVTTVDIVLEPLKVVQMMIDADDPDAEWGIWLTPFRGVPVARMFSPFDLVYLDEDYRVVESVELFPAAGLAPFEGQAASALLLPLHTVSSSRTGAGDQLVICAAEEMADQLASATAAAAPAPVLQSAEAPVEQLQDNDDLAPALAEDRSAQQQAAIQPLDEKKAELQPQTPQAQAPRAQTPQAQAPQAQRKDALRARFLRRIEEMAHQQARVFRSTLPAAALRRTEATAEQPGEAGGLAPALAADRSGLQRGAIEPLDKKKKVVSKAHAAQAQAEDSLRARFQRWLYPEIKPTDRRRSDRRPWPGLVAYYWTGGAPKAHKIADISATGFYLLTEERWAPATILQMTLQKSDAKRGDPEGSISVLSKVVRSGSDGVAQEFVLSGCVNPKSGGSLPGKGTDKEDLERFL